MHNIDANLGVPYTDRVTVNRLLASIKKDHLDQWGKNRNWENKEKECKVFSQEAEAQTESGGI